MGSDTLEKAREGKPRFFWFNKLAPFRRGNSEKKCITRSSGVDFDDFLWTSMLILVELCMKLGGTSQSVYMCSCPDQEEVWARHGLRRSKPLCILQLAYQCISTKHWSSINCTITRNRCRNTGWGLFRSWLFGPQRSSRKSFDWAEREVF